MAQQTFGPMGAGFQSVSTISYPSIWDRIQQRRQQQTASQIGQAGASALSNLIGSYNKAYKSARAANEARYQQMLGITDQTTGQRAADIRTAYGQQGADMMQNLARLGMANTTVAPTMQLGVQREQQSALNRLADEMQGTKLGIMERRTDQYPDVNLITSLASMFGQGIGQSGGDGSGLAKMLSALGNVRMG